MLLSHYNRDIPEVGFIDVSKNKCRTVKLRMREWTYRVVTTRTLIEWVALYDPVRRF